MIWLAIFCALLLYTLCRASSTCSQAEREREDEVLYWEMKYQEDAIEPKRSIG